VPAGIIVDVCNVMLGLDSILRAVDVVFWVAFVSVFVTKGYGLWWGDVSSISYLFLIEIYV
jgi:hypothetical protein